MNDINFTSIRPRKEVLKAIEKVRYGLQKTVPKHLKVNINAVNN